MRICIDPGHGGVDPGATKDGKKEAVINLAISKMVEAKLRVLKHDVIKTHDTLPPTKKLRNLERCKIANDAKAEAYIAIHCNSSVSEQAHGYEVIHCPNSLKGAALAHSLSGTLVAVIKARPRPVITDEDTGRGPYTVLRKTKAPAVIVECGFISNPDDRKILTTRPKEIADAISLGIDKFAKEV